MAKAKKIAVKIQKVVTEMETVVELQLTPEEATVLYTILKRVGGSPSTSSRKHADSMLNAIVDAGVRLSNGTTFTSGDPLSSATVGSITFNDKLTTN
jgi:hypothetical protein